MTDIKPVPRLFFICQSNDIENLEKCDTAEVKITAEHFLSDEVLEKLREQNLHNVWLEFFEDYDSTDFLAIVRQLEKHPDIYSCHLDDAEQINTELLSGFIDNKDRFMVVQYL